MTDVPKEGPLPPGLRLLQWLVVGLTLSMIGGVITVVWLLVTRMPVLAPQAAPSALPEMPALPASVTLPAGETAAAVTLGAGWFAVVTGSGRLLVYGADGKLRQEVVLDLP